MKDRATENHEEYAIVLIDGVCHLCQGLTQFIIKRSCRCLSLRFAAIRDWAGVVEAGRASWRYYGNDGAD